MTQAIIDHNKLDQDLYDHGRKLFEQQIEKLVGCCPNLRKIIK
jgi:hypothetical protein